MIAHYVWYRRLPHCRGESRVITFSADVPLMPISHICSRADQIFRALISTSRLPRWRRLVSVGSNSVVASPARISAQWVTFRLWILDVFVIRWVDEKGIASVEGSQIVEVAIDSL